MAPFCFQVVSDLHIGDGDTADVVLPRRAAGTDVLVVAGDVGTLRVVVEVVDCALERWPHVVFVPGNHDYWTKGHRTHEDALAALRALAAERPGLTVLDCDTATVCGHTFVGATLWASPPVEDAWRLNDFRHIHTGPANVYSKQHKRLTPLDMAAMNLAAKQYLTNTVRQGDIVVTHFMPVTTSALVRAHGRLSKYAHMGMESYYGNTGLEDVIGRAAVWVFGHTHEEHAASIDGCLLVCNPRREPHGHTEPVPVRVVAVFDTRREEGMTSLK